MGWDSGRYPEQVKRGMEHSSQVISAWDGDKLIGLVRGLDDGETVAFSTTCWWTRPIRASISAKS